MRVFDSRIEMPLPFGLPQFSGIDRGDTSDSVVRIVSIRSIALRNVRLRSRGREITVSADSSLDGSTLTLQRFMAESGATALAVTGVVMLSPRIDARLEAKAGRLDVDELLALADAFTPPSAGAAGAGRQGPRIVASITADQATAGALRLESFTTELTLDGDAWH